MKRVILTLLFLLLGLYSLFATMTFYLKEAPLYVYDTNVFSDPLVQNGNKAWLEWAARHPFIKRHSLGTYTEFDIFFSGGDRTGLSMSLTFGWPLKSNSYTPVGNFSNGDWHYEVSDSLSSQDVSVFFSIGPIFRASFDFFEVGASIKLSLGSYASFLNDIVFGVQVDPFMNFFIQEGFFLTLGIHYDAHLFLFFLHDPISIYQENYVMMGIGGYVGLGFSFGKREDTAW